MKKILLILSFILLFNFNCFAEAQEFLMPGVNGPVFQNNVLDLIKPATVSTKQNTVITTSTKSTVTISNNDISNNIKPALAATKNVNLVQGSLPIGGVFNDGFTWGLMRIVKTMNKNDTTVSIADCVEIAKTEIEGINIKQTYQVTLDSNNKWRKGNWVIDIYPIDEEYRKVLEGYNSWFGYYDENKMFIGIAQAKKVN